MQQLGGGEQAVGGAALLAGLASGLRSQIVFPLLGIAIGKRGEARGGLITAWAELPELRKLAILVAGGELVIDKLPFTPDRRGRWPLTGRMVFGALAGVMVATEAGMTPSDGLWRGAAGALVGTHAGYWARRWLATVTVLPDPIVALAEDVAAVSAARKAVSFNSLNALNIGKAEL